MSKLVSLYSDSLSKFLVLLILVLIISCGEHKNKPIAYAIHGIDVSHFQGKVDWEQVKEQNVLFAFIKATEGLDHCDTMFYVNWKSLKLTDIKRGAYHFFIPNLDPKLQAENFMMNVSLQNGDLPPVLDMEVTDYNDPDALVENIRTWLNLMSIAYKTKPILYTNLKAYFRFIAGRFDDYPVWIARYSDRAPDLGNNKDWAFWQYANSGKIEGIREDVDFDAFYGTYQQLDSICLKNLPTSEFLELK
ncbi:MAG: GH25 family lysozyme [Saprospiraceae bacterium]